MTACNYLYLLVIVGVIMGWSGRAGADIIGVPGATPSTSTTASGPAVADSANDATTAKPAAHPSSHHKKKKSVAAGGTASTGPKKVAATATGPGAKKAATPAANKANAKKMAATTAGAGAKKVAGPSTANGAKNVAKGPASNAKMVTAATAGAGAKSLAAAPGAETATVATTTTGTATGPLSKRKKGHSRHSTVAAGKPAKTSPSAASPSGALTIDAPLDPSTAVVNLPTAPATVVKSTGAGRTPITITEPPPSAPSTRSSAGPVVETGLPIARHSGYDPSDPIPDAHGAAGSYQIASAFPVPSSITPVGSYTPRHVETPLDHFKFTNFARHGNVYPWKYNILTTEFWIGEGSTPVSSTTNVDSAWELDWRSKNGGTDTPDDRQGYMPGHHAARENPFYVALPFNDLAFPDKAREWLPSGWYRRPRDGRQVSACQHRWLEIKNAQGRVCYAQWEDVGPLNYADAEYVFGSASPQGLNGNRAGLDVSPAVADYLSITGRNCLTRWRFVDDSDVEAGLWLKYDEEAVIFRAMHQLKDDSNQVLPIQRATAPIDDEEDLDSAKKKLGAAKG